MIPRRALQFLVVAALLLPIVICVVAGTGKLLNALNDETGATILDRVAIGCGMIWVVDLIVLAVAQGVNGSYEPPEEGEE